VSQGGIDDLDKLPSFDVGATPRRSTSSLGDMEVTYKFRVDAALLSNVNDRYYQQRPLPFRLPVQFGFLALIVGAPLSQSKLRARIQDWDCSDRGCVSILGGVALTKWGIYRRFRYRADFGTEATVTMSAAGLVASGPHVEGRDWAA